MGSGTYVSGPRAAGALSFGLLIPDLGETDIFEPMCQGMMASPLARTHALVWGSVSGDGTSKEDRAWQLCRQYIERRVSACSSRRSNSPLGGRHKSANRAGARRRAHPDRATRSDRDAVPASAVTTTFVGIDNRRAGFLITSHVLGLGSQRVAFVAQPNAAATVDAREAGYREALYAADLPIDRALVHRLEPSDVEAVRQLMESARPDAIVCANDRTAGRLMQTVIKLGYACPRTSGWSASTTWSLPRCCRCR